MQSTVQLPPGAPFSGPLSHLVELVVFLQEYETTYSSPLSRCPSPHLCGGVGGPHFLQSTVQLPPGAPFSGPLSHLLKSAEFFLKRK